MLLPIYFSCSAKHNFVTWFTWFLNWNLVSTYTCCTLRSKKHGPFCSRYSLFLLNLRTKDATITWSTKNLSCSIMTDGIQSDIVTLSLSFFFFLEIFASISPCYFTLREQNLTKISNTITQMLLKLKMDY